MSRFLALIALTLLSIAMPIFAHADLSEFRVCSLRDAERVVSFAKDDVTKKIKIISIDAMKAQDVLVVTPVMAASLNGTVLVPTQGQFELGTLENVTHILTVDDVPGSDKKHLYVDSVMQVSRVLMVSKAMTTPFSASVLCPAD